MKKPLISVAVTVGAVLALLSVAFLIATSRLESVVMETVPTAGFEIAGVEVSLADVQISAIRGRAEATALSIGNPPGFKARQALSLDSVKVDLDMHSLTSDPVIIQRIELTGLQITIESGGKGNNLDVIERNVEAYLRSGAPAKSVAEGGEQPSPRLLDNVRVVVENLVIPGAKVNFQTHMLFNARIPTTVADIEMTDVGRESGGLTIAELSETILNALADGIGRAAAPDQVNS